MVAIAPRVTRRGLESVSDVMRFLYGWSLRHGESGNVSNTCRLYGVLRDTLYR
jgi:hypothetical protein